MGSVVRSDWLQIGAVRVPGADRLKKSSLSADFQDVDSSRALPTGVVTFLLTDIEGSTRRWEAEPDAMRDALVRHDTIVNTCVRRLNGHVVKSKGEGDSVFAVFRLAREAVAAALVLQCALAAEEWSTRTPIRVRMAIHTGQVELRDGDYYGPTVNRCARLRALASGGQVLISGATAKLTEGQMPNGASLIDLGIHQLKDLSAPERVWQLAHPRMSSAAVASMAQPSQVARGAAPVSQQQAVSSARAYILTDHTNRDAAGREWFERASYEASGLNIGTSLDAILCYATPAVAALMNTANEGFRLPRLWEARVEPEPAPDEAILACTSVTVIRQATLPIPTGLHHARFAVLCARAALEDGGYDGGEFDDWVLHWLAGEDASGAEARDVAEDLERNARPDPHSGLTLPHPLMMANAARAAGAASKLSWLVGRARDEENARAITCASQAVQTAIRVANIDLVALADEVLPTPKTTSPVTPARAISPRLANRILTALPT